MDLPFKTDLYSKVKSTWPNNGKVILASHTEGRDSNEGKIIVYQAYKSSIAKYAVDNQTFKNCPDFSTNRMTWIKTNFLWMMYRSDWATKLNQERILAISITAKGFKEILENATISCTTKKTGDSSTKKEGNLVEIKDDVRLQWDPDHDPFGEKLERRAIQLGIRGKVLGSFLNNMIVRIDDITEFVEKQREYVNSNQLELLQIPAETIYDVNDPVLTEHIDLTIL